MPKRIQRKRSKGWRLPPDAVCVTRPGIFGNPWTYKKTLESGLFRVEAIPEVNVKSFRAWLAADEAKEAEFEIYRELRERKKRLLAELHRLRGKDLACFCPLSKPCHADVLLELANA